MSNKVTGADFKISCSQIFRIVGDFQTKPLSQKIADLENSLPELTAKRDAWKPELKSWANADDKIKAAKKEIERLKALPREIELPEMARTLCEEWLSDQVYQRRKEVSAATLEKGNRVENASIQYASFVYRWGWDIEKNDTRISNEYMTGECDVLRPDVSFVHDMKNSWDHRTFPLWKKEIPDLKYDWQTFGYKILYGVKNASVVYCLCDLPDDMVEREVYKKHGRDFTKEQYDAVKAYFTYSHLPDKLRLKEFLFLENENDKGREEIIKQRVDLCRAYIDELLKHYQQ